MSDNTFKDLNKRVLLKLPRFWYFKPKFHGMYMEAAVMIPVAAVLSYLWSKEEQKYFDSFPRQGRLFSKNPDAPMEVRKMIY